MERRKSERGFAQSSCKSFVDIRRCYLHESESPAKLRVVLFSKMAGASVQETPKEGFCRERGDRPAVSTSDQPDYGSLRKSGDLHRRQEGSTDRCHVASRGAVSNSDDSGHASHRSNFSKKMSAEEKFRETSQPSASRSPICL
jgi:hypothetical protein